MQVKAKLTKLKQKRAEQSITHYGAGSLERETIQECTNNGIKFVQFFVICDILVLEEESCSGNLYLEHDITPYYLLSYREILSHLSSYGKKILGAKGCSSLHSNESNTPETLHEITEWLIHRLQEIKDQTGTASLDTIIQRYNKSFSVNF